MVELSVNMCGINFKNPVMVASGTFGYGREYAEYYDLSLLGAIVVKGVSLSPWQGNPLPRIAETPSGMLNAIGLQNPGVDYFLREDLPFLKQFDTKVIVNVVGTTVEEYRTVCEKLDRAGGIAALEINISCPNIKKGGIQFGSNPDLAAKVIEDIKKVTGLPLIVKLSPNVTDLTEIASAVENAGADALSLINTLLGMVIDVKKQKPVLANTFGGLSGPAIRPVALRMVWQVYEKVGVPIIGSGGIVNTEDALQFVLAGASFVSIGTANFINPYAAVDVLRGLEAYLDNEGVSYNSLIGAAHEKKK